MKKTTWLTLDDESLERMLVERWLSRGLILCAMLAAAIGVTYFAVAGFTTWADRLTAGALFVLVVSAGAAGFTMRLTDIRIHKELRRRRSVEGTR